MQSIFLCLIIVTLCMPKCLGISSVQMPQDVMLNDAPSAPGYSLLRNDITRQNLRVVRGLSSPLLHVHLPIQMRAQKGQVCRVEVEECQPLLSMVGHLEPKKFDCSFADGDVVYYHGGNPLTNHDHVQVTIFFFRDNNSVVQTVDIMVDVVDESTYTGAISWITSGDRSGVPNGNDPKFMENFSERIQVLDQLNVSSLKATSNSIGPDVLRIFYDREKEVCRLSFTSPDYGMENEETIYSNAGLHAPKLGQPLAAGSAVGGVHRWPLFGQIVAFNRSTIYAFHHDCQEALIQGYRYMHRKANSPETDFVPIVVTIWRRQEDGSKLLLIRKGIFLRVFIANGLQLIMPVVRTFRQVNVTHIGGSLSVLPRDSISVPHDAVPGMELLDVNMTRMQGPLQAQIVNLRDPTRPVTSFRMNDLRGGLVALQLLNYAEALVKVFVITLTVVDPFFQVSKPVNLKIATFLQPVVQMDMAAGPYLQRTPSFQVFSLPLFTYTGAVSLVHKHNIQVVGYIDESVITYTVQSWRPNFDGRISSENKRQFGSLRLDGRFAEGLVFGPPHIVAMRLTYAHTGGYTPTIERVPLSVSVPGLTRHFRTARVRRSLAPLSTPPHQTGKNTIHDGHLGSLSLRRERNTFMTRRNRRRRRRNEDSSPELQLELSVRIVRLYNRIPDGALRSGATYRLAGSSYLCFTAEDLLTAEALQAVRSDLVNLAFTVKVTPSLGVLTYRSVITKLRKHRPPSDAFGSSTDAVTRSDAELAVAQEQHILEQFQVSEITVHELEAGDICYINQRRDRITDLIGLRQTGRHDFPTVYMNLELLPPSRIVLSERMDPNVFMRARETAPHVVITPLHLNHILQFADPYNGYATNNLTEESLAPDSVVYQITGPPRFAATDTSVGGVEATHEAGRLVSLSAVTASTHEGDMNLQPGLSTSLREAEAPSVTEFTQKQINDGDIVYVPPVSDIGIMDKFVVVYYAVTGPGNVRLPDRQLRVLIVAEDNQAPKMEVLHPLDVARDGELLLNSDLISISDVDTASDRLSVHFERLPRYGEISLLMKDPRKFNSTYPVPVTEGQRLSVSMFKAGQLKYRQTGANVKSDDFVLSVTDGVQPPQALRIPLQIKPRVLHERRLNQIVNNSVIVEENGTVILHPSIFPSANDTNEGHYAGSSAPQYFLIVFPTKGNLILNNRQKVSQFSYADIHKGRLAYRHGPAEIGVDPMLDFAKIWDFNEGKTFSLNFTLVPVNSQPPRLHAEAPVQVKEGGRALIDQYILHATDPDTAEANIQLQIIHAPRWGHIAVADIPVNTTSPRLEGLIPVVDGNLTETMNFSMQFLKDGRIYYVNSLHADGRESVEDVFSVRAFDGSLYSSQIVEVKVAILPVNDEIPIVRLLRYFSVSLGARRILTPYLFSVSDKDVPRDMLQIQFTQLPIFGNLTVYWQHGEKSLITKTSPPITESYLGMMNLLYVQNESLFSASSLEQPGPNSSKLLGMDRFTVTVSDGHHVIEKQAHILIRSHNKYAPEMTVDQSNPDGLVLEGVPWTRLDKKPGGLIIADQDTSEDDLIITIIQAPKHGSIQRLPRLDRANGVELLDLIEDAWDTEEALAADNEQEQARMALAGSVGGPKSLKTLKAGDRFTKRQMDTERIHYVYTGSYKETDVYDSCSLRLSDGDYEAPVTTLRFRIRRTAGRAGSSSLRYSPTDQIQVLRPVEYADQIQTEAHRMQDPTMEKMESKAFQQMDDSGLADMTRPAIRMPPHEACVEQHTFLNFRSLEFEPLNLSENANHPSGLVNFTLHVTEGYNFSHEGRIQPMACGHFIMADEPLDSVTQFSANDVRELKIAFAAKGCKPFIEQTVDALFMIHIPFTPSPLYAVLPIRITKRCRRVPELERIHPVFILPGADIPVNSKNLLFTDQDTSPANLVFIISRNVGIGSTQNFGRLLTEKNETVYLFTQSELNAGQVIFSSDTNVIWRNGDRQFVELHVFDAGEFDGVLEAASLNGLVGRAFKVLQQHGTAEANPFNERMQYIADRISRTLSIKPVRLEIAPASIQAVRRSDSKYALLIRRAPAPHTLGTIKPGRVGFRLNAMNLYAEQPDATYRLIQLRGNRGEFFNLRTNHSVSTFSQEDLNRRRIAFILFDTPKKRTLDAGRERGTKQLQETSVDIDFEIIDPNARLTQAHESLRLEWMRIGFQRRSYRVCEDRGLLRLGVQRYGASEAIQNVTTDAYVGLTSQTAVEGQDFSLHSQKLLTFRLGETRKFVYIRLHPRTNGQTEKREFFVDLKSPSGAMLDWNRRAYVVIRANSNCKDRAYFSPQHRENPTRRDTTYLTQAEFGETQVEKMSADDNGVRNAHGLSHSARPLHQTRSISLHEWLAINELPDSQTLSVTYQEFLHKKQTNRCTEGWHFYENRCYQSATEGLISWNQARKQCELQGAFLTSINDANHLKWLHQSFSLQNPYWIGLHQQRPGSDWIWHNFERAGFHNWENGSPVEIGWTRKRRSPRRHAIGPVKILSSEPFILQSPARRTKRQARVRWGPKACVLVKRDMLWKNQSCNKPKRAGFICMRNPEV
ncbi:hypothetical protein T265_03832 [Opisthorchis viverrini]|uniref:C-type lectin domain-containing protein n=1 Tax=Opisthorchis viverrini TaxID=6198 RepID=A0A075A290_OPIVI|nr:hypothetical protein T265_03832 [Opisthorchis viverrini]KER29635.1 hypothetical protein T265_03832 [Opisthorchis viverrini]